MVCHPLAQAALHDARGPEELDDPPAVCLCRLAGLHGHAAVSPMTDAYCFFGFSALGGFAMCTYVLRRLLS